MTQLWACVPRTGRPKRRPASTFEVAATAAHVGRARGAEAAVGALRPPQAEVDHLVAPGGEADPGGLGRDQRLEVDEVEERRLDELRVEDRPPHPDEGLVGEDDRALGDGVDVAAQAQLAQLAQEGGVEERTAVVAEEACQVGDVLGREVEARQVVERAGEAAGHREAAAEGVAPEEEVEDGLLLRPARVPVGLGHGQLVQVRREGERGPVDVGETRHAAIMRQDGAPRRGATIARASRHRAAHGLRPPGPLRGGDEGRDPVRVPGGDARGRAPRGARPTTWPRGRSPSMPPTGTSRGAPSSWRSWTRASGRSAGRSRWAPAAGSSWARTTASSRSCSRPTPSARVHLLANPLLFREPTLARLPRARPLRPGRRPPGPRPRARRGRPGGRGPGSPRRSPPKTRRAEGWEGAVLHVDRFGNLTTNLLEADLAALGRGGRVSR